LRHGVHIQSTKPNLCHAGSPTQTVLCLNFFDDAHYYYLDWVFRRFCDRLWRFKRPICAGI